MRDNNLGLMRLPMIKYGRACLAAILVAALFTTILVSSVFPQKLRSLDNSRNRQRSEQPSRKVDDPADEAPLNRELWQFVKGTDYRSILPYIVAEQRKSQANQNALVELPNGWRIAPAGKQVEVGRLPYEAVSFAGKLVVLDTGYYKQESQEVTIVNINAGQVEKTLKIHSLFPSAEVGFDGDLYISGGFDQKVFRVNRQFKIIRAYAVRGFAGGLAPIDAEHLAVGYMATRNAKRIYVNGRLAILNTRTGKIENEIPLGYFPYGLRYVGAKFFVTLLGENKLLVYSRDLKLLDTISVGFAPQEMCTEARQLYVVNTNSDSLSVVDVNSNRLLSTLSLAAAGSKFGVSPTSCALDDGHLYITVAGSNSLRVIDRRTGSQLTEIPTGWYPTKVVLDDGKILILNAKGIQSRRPNVNGPSPLSTREPPEYVLNLLKGSLSIVEQSDLKPNADKWTNQVQSASPLFDSHSMPATPIKHVFYIIKENRTYDQVLGDLPRGNGDPKLTLFNESVTPIQHQLAREFVTLDNFFVDGEISVLGHSFTTSGYASPFIEWFGNTSYSERWNGYPFGSVPATMSPVYLWDLLEDQKIDYRIHGETYFLFSRAYRILVEMYGADSQLARHFYDQTIKTAGGDDRGTEFNELTRPYYGRATSPADAYKLLNDPDFVKRLSNFLTGDETFSQAVLKDDVLHRRFADYLSHYSFDFRSWDLNVSDLDRVRDWKNDFESQLRQGKIAQLNYIWLPNNHTDGAKSKILNPFQFVAQNDAALGRIVEIISHSSIWKDSLILVVEDDSQNGPDHVDATRTIAFAAGPYVKRDSLVSDRYDQISMLRTIEIVLGLHSVNSAEQLAAPMFGIFTDKPDFRPFVPREPSKYLANADRERYLTLRH